MSGYLVVIAIGPVQSYISQARRTQDLWFGSELLGYLAHSGLKLIQSYVDQKRAQFIYPQLELDVQLRAIPNRFVFHHLGDAATVQNDVDAVARTIRQQWATISDATYEHFRQKGYIPHTGREIWDEIWQRQTASDNWLEVYWVAVPYTADYQVTIRRANEALAARKMIRNFNQLGEPGHKCSVNGEGEALRAENRSVEAVQKYWDSIQATIRQKNGNLALLSKGERLSASTAIKRFAHEAVADLNRDDEGRFPSTSSIACITFKSAVVDIWDQTTDTARNLRECVMNYLDVLESLFNKDHYFTKDRKYNPEPFPKMGERKDPNQVRFLSIDGSFFYEGFFASREVENYTADGKRPKDVEPALRALRALYNAARLCGIKPPSSYLAVVKLDGDKMGKKVEQFENAEQHAYFSGVLARFAQKDVVEIVEEKHLGKLIFSGGDDVLALVPIRDALAVAEQLRQRFTTLSHEFASHFPFDLGLTASAGIAYVHHTYPLQAGIRAANDAEHIAKEEIGRPAMAVKLLRRSGEHQTWGMTWDIHATSNTTVDLVTALKEGFAAGVLSHNLPYALDEMIYAMVASLGTTDQIPAAARRAELGRLIERRSDQTKYEDACQKLPDTIASFRELFGIEIKPKEVAWTQQLSNLLSSIAEARSWHSLNGTLHLARFLAQGEASNALAND